MLIFPGLASTPIRKRPIGRVAYRPHNNENSIRDREVVVAEPDLSAPVPPAELGATEVATSSVVTGSSADAGPPAIVGPPALALTEVVKLDRAAGEFCNAEFNFIKVLAETTVFFGLILLKWSAGLTKPKRVKSLVKAIIVLVFLAIHPIYCVMPIFVLSAVYTYFQLHTKLKD